MRTLPPKLVSATGAAGTANRTAAEVLYRRFLKVAEAMAAIAMEARLRRQIMAASMGRR